MCKWQHLQNILYTWLNDMLLTESSQWSVWTWETKYLLKWSEEINPSHRHFIFNLSSIGTVFFSFLYFSMILISFSFVFLFYLQNSFCWMSPCFTQECVCVCVLFLSKEGSDLHADGFEWVPRAFPVHPHNAIICSVFGHIFRVSSAPVVSAVGIGRMAGVVPPATPIFSWTLLRRVTGYPVKC